MTVGESKDPWSSAICLIPRTLHRCSQYSSLLNISSACHASSQTQLNLLLDIQAWETNLLIWMSVHGIRLLFLLCWWVGLASLVCFLHNLEVESCRGRENLHWELALSVKALREISRHTMSNTRDTSPGTSASFTEAHQWSCKLSHHENPYISLLIK